MPAQAAHLAVPACQRVGQPPLPPAEPPWKVWQTRYAGCQPPAARTCLPRKRARPRGRGCRPAECPSCAGRARRACGRGAGWQGRGAEVQGVQTAGQAGALLCTTAAESHAVETQCWHAQGAASILTALIVSHLSCSRRRSGSSGRVTAREKGFWQMMAALASISASSGSAPCRKLGLRGRAPLQVGLMSAGSQRRPGGRFNMAGLPGPAVPCPAVP